MMDREKLTVIVRKINSDELGYLAIVKSFGAGVFFAYIKDNVFGAITLNRFLEMIRTGFNVKQISIKLELKKVEIRSNFLLQALKEAEETEASGSDIPL